MDFSFFFDGFIVGLIASVPLGPIGVLCIQRTLSKGRWSGFISGLGAASSDAIYAIIACFSLSYVVSFIEKQMLWLQIFGVALMLFLGLRIFYSNPAKQLRRQKSNSKNFVQDFASVFFLTISNPLYVFLFIGIFAGLRFVQPQNDIIGQMVLILGVLAGASAWWFVLTSIVNLFRAKINLRRLWWINKIAGGVIVLAALFSFLYWLIHDFFQWI
ncbi:MAG: LysE family translocator [Marinilabiliaceae bacterium]|nr:LysE family translocator [Marinilabiliaceae bacterium]